MIIIFLYLLFEINESRNVLSINFIFLILVLFLYEKIPNSFSDYIEILLVAVIGYFIFFRKIYKLRNFIGITLSLSILSVKNLNIKSNVLYTPGGSDPLKYESWSQQIVHFCLYKEVRMYSSTNLAIGIYYLCYISCLVIAILQYLFSQDLYF